MSRHKRIAYAILSLLMQYAPRKQCPGPLK